MTIGGFSIGATIMDDAPAAVETALGASHLEPRIAIARHGRRSVAASLGEGAIAEALAVHGAGD